MDSWKCMKHFFWQIQRFWRVLYSGIYCPLFSWMSIDISEEQISSIFHGRRRSKDRKKVMKQATTNKPRKKQTWKRVCLMLGLLFNLKMEAIFSSETLLTFFRLHDIIFQNTEIFTVTSVRPENPTQNDCVYFAVAWYLLLTMELIFLCC
jgi:hypothetical protein